MTPVASLCRVSSAGQAADDKAGLPRQRDAVALAASRHGLRVVKSYELVDVDGSLVGSTREWGEIRSLLSAGIIKGVVVDNIDRLCRASDLDLGVLADLQRAGGTLYTPGEVRSLASGADGLLAGIMALIAGHEKRRIVERSVEAKESKRRQGVWCESDTQLPPGVKFDRETRTWSYTDDVHDVIECARLLLAGESIYAIAKSRGIGRTTLRKRLKHSLYRGELVFDKKYIGDRLAGTETEVQRKPENVIRLTVLDPPAFSPDMAKQIDAALAKTRRQYTPTVLEKNRHHYRGLLRCSRCGGLVTTIRRDGADQYRCGVALRMYSFESDPSRTCDAGGIKADDLHEVLTKMVLEKVQAKGWLTFAICSALEALDGDDRAERANGIKRRLEALVSKRERLLDAFMSGLATKDQLERRKGLLDRQIEGLEAELADLGPVTGTWLERLLEESERAAEPVRRYVQGLADVEGKQEQVEAVARFVRGLGGVVHVEKDKGKWSIPEVVKLELDPRRVGAFVRTDLGTGPAAGTERRAQ